MTKNNSKNWLQIKEEFIKYWLKRRDVARSDLVEYASFFKPYFQEQRHKEAVEELEVVDNSNTDTNS